MKIIKKTIQTRPRVNCAEVCNPHAIFLVFSCHYAATAATKLFAQRAFPKVNDRHT